MFDYRDQGTGLLYLSVFDGSILPQAKRLGCFQLYRQTETAVVIDFSRLLGVWGDCLCTAPQREWFLPNWWPCLSGRACVSALRVAGNIWSTYVFMYHHMFWPKNDACDNVEYIMLQNTWELLFLSQLWKGNWCKSRGAKFTALGFSEVPFLTRWYGSPSMLASISALPSVAHICISDQLWEEWLHDQAGAEGMRICCHVTWSWQGGGGLAERWSVQILQFAWENLFGISLLLLTLPTPVRGRSGISMCELWLSRERGMCILLRTPQA